MALTLEPPSARFHDSFLESLVEWGSAFQHGASIRSAADLALSTRDGFTTWVERLLLQADPAQGLPADRVTAHRT